MSSTRYMLAYMLPGDAAAYHRTLSDHLAERFRLDQLSSRIDPHFTLKAPFKTDDLSEITELIETFAAKERPVPVTVFGISDFHREVIYLDASAPKQTHMLVRRLQDQLRGVSWLTFNRHEFPITLHATLIHAKNPQQGKEIRSHLRKLITPMFKISLDSITLLEKSNGTWDPVRVFPLGSS